MNFENLSEAVRSINAFWQLDRIQEVNPNAGES
jgi:hypothetical protein